ncbi:MAG: mucoidy inhibitor MuiA family protein, partial [Chloroflexi bacterium]|nr:mucoidy inhibitor MuiA family protein [Chloroflexota bacterium]
MLEIHSRVVEVSVFADRARVTRRGTLTAETGVQQIVFGELPLSLVPDSVRAAGRGVAASLLGVDTRRTYFAETPSANARELESQIEALQDQDKALADQASAADTQIAFAKSLAEQAAEQLARGIALGRASVEQVGALIQVTQSQLAEAQARARTIAQQRRELAKQLTKLTNDLNGIRSARPRERMSATLEVAVEQTGELMLDLTYVVNAASW